MGKNKKMRGRVRPRRGGRARAQPPRELSLKVGSGVGVVGINFERPTRSINLNVLQAMELAQAIIDAAARAQAAAEAKIAGLAMNTEGMTVGPDGQPVISRPSPREPRKSD